MTNSTVLTKLIKNNDNIQNGGKSSKKSGSKKSSSKKSGSKKSSSKKSGSKKSSSKKSGSKKSSSKKSGSKKSSSKKSGSKQKRELPPALKASQVTNKKISEKLGYKISPGLIKFVSTFRQEAKKGIKDEKDFVSINKKTLELFEEHLSKHGKAKLLSEVEKLANDIKNSRKKSSK